ncbi:MAG: hypothetical protein AB8B87_26855 [Granulosicoccus sp.]
MSNDLDLLKYQAPTYLVIIKAMKPHAYADPPIEHIGKKVGQQPYRI